MHIVQGKIHISYSHSKHSHWGTSEPGNIQANIVSVRREYDYFFPLYCVNFMIMAFSVVFCVSVAYMIHYLHTSNIAVYIDNYQLAKD